MMNMLSEVVLWRFPIKGLVFFGDFAEPWRDFGTIRNKISDNHIQSPFRSATDTGDLLPTTTQWLVIHFTHAAIFVGYSADPKLIT